MRKTSSFLVEWKNQDVRWGKSFLSSQQLWELGGKVAPPQLNTVTLSFLEDISHNSLIGMNVEQGERLVAQSINFTTEK